MFGLIVFLLLIIFWPLLEWNNKVAMDWQRKRWEKNHINGKQRNPHKDKSGIDADMNGKIDWYEM